MLATLHIGSELRRFGRAKLGKIAIVAICLLPLLYSTLYLWSFWDPFGRLDRMPVALVNEDAGAEVDGQRIDAGKQIEEGLLEDQSLDWITVTEQDALEGVKTGEYYFAVTLPENFSQAVASPTSENPEKARIVTHYNDANGWLSTLIGQNAMRQVLAVVSDKIGTEAVDKLLVGVVNASEGIQRAADGAAQLDDGATKLDSGLGKIQQGAGDLVSGLERNKEGTTQLVEGTGRLREGADKLQAGSGELANGTERLVEGTNQLSGGIDQAIGKLQSLTGEVHHYHATASEASELQGSLAQDLRDLAAAIRQIPDPLAQQTAGQVDHIAHRVDTEGVGPHSPLKQDLDRINGIAADIDQGNLPGKLGELVGGVNQLNDGAQALNDGAHRLNAGIGELGSGVTRLDDGANKLNDGATQLLDGGRTLDSALAEAKDGSSKLSAGSNELATKLGQAAGEAPDWSPDHRTTMAETIGGPVEINQSNSGGENTFGAGLAPFFFSLALYIGSLVSFLLLRPLQARAVAAGISPLRAAIDGLAPAGLIAMIQAIVVSTATVLAVPLEPATFFGLTVFMMLTALVFAAMNQVLIVLLGSGPGRVASMALLMVQLLGSGGLYPVETEPDFWSWIHPFLPMTYTVNGFRQTLYGDFDGRMLQAVIALCLFLTLFLVGTALGARRDRTWTMKKLHPPIDF
ncbi:MULTISPECIES: YhgE/Pip domain-containing protein [Corynebacterium]|uniref:YhgE/Pip domain-containing protein n=1 Tax=Corynebacterium TaxID=1716 RepID=UPI00124F6890|nr:MULTISPECIES: YhgE/Pip domain-containing protein [Corynebacterium]